MAATSAQRRRAVSKEALRDQLRAGGHLQHVIDMANTIANPANDLEPDMLARYKVAIDTKLKLINKYLPDVKSVEVTGEDGAPLVPTKTVIEFVHSPHKDA